jgi:transketolase
VHLVANATYPWGKAQVLSEGKDITVVASGPMVAKAIEAGAQLQAAGITATVISNPFVNRVDLATIGAAVRATSGRLITIEDHQVLCGMGAMVSHALSCAGIAHQAKSLGIQGDFGQSAYLADQLYQRNGMSAAGIVEAAKALMAGK